MTHTRILATLLFLACIAFHATRVSPRYNWDLLPYVAAALHINGEPRETLHATTYQTARQEIPEPAFRRLLEENAYRRAMAETPHYFLDQLVFTTVKPGYTHLVAGLGRAGIPLVRATLLISLAAYVATCCLIFVWLGRYFPPWLALILGVGFSSAYQLMAVARLSTPDMLSGFLTLLSIYLFLEHGRAKTAAAVLVTTLTLRPDNVFLVALFLVYLFCLDKKLRIAATVGAVCAAAIYLGEVALSGNPGWRVLFHHTFVQLLNEPSTFQSPLSTRDYLRHLYWSLLPTLFVGDFYRIVTMGVLAFVARLGWAGTADRYAQVLAISVTFIVINCVALPLDVDRRQVGVHLFIIIALACTVGEMMKNAVSRPPLRGSSLTEHRTA